MLAFRVLPVSMVLKNFEGHFLSLSGWSSILLLPFLVTYYSERKWIEPLENLNESSQRGNESPSDYYQERRPQYVQMAGCHIMLTQFFILGLARTGNVCNGVLTSVCTQSPWHPSTSPKQRKTTGKPRLHHLSGF